MQVIGYFPCRHGHTNDRRVFHQRSPTLLTKVNDHEVAEVRETPEATNRQPLTRSKQTASECPDHVTLRGLCEVGYILNSTGGVFGVWSCWFLF